MTVFVLMRHVKYEFGEPLGVYSSRTLAESEQKRAQERLEYQTDEIDIHETTLDRRLEVINNMLQ